MAGKSTKKDFVTKQMRKGRTRKQAEATWRLLHSEHLQRWRKTRSKSHPWAKHFSSATRAKRNPSHWETVDDMLGRDISGVFEVDKYGSRDIDLNEDDLIPYSALSAPNIGGYDPARSVYLSPYLSYGDYDGSTAVERANFDVFTQEHGEKPGVYEIYGGYGSRAVGVGLWVDDEEIIETLAALTDYPLISDEAHSEKEMEMEQEALESWAGSDFISKLQKAFDIDIDDYDDERMQELFWEALSRAGEKGDYAYVEGGGNVVFPFKQMVNQVKWNDLDKAGFEYEPV